MEYVLHNKVLMPVNQFCVNADNRAFSYGDGVFESILIKKGKIRFLKDHYQRLLQGLAAFGFIDIDFLTFDFLEQRIMDVANKNNLKENARIKILAWRKSGGLYTPSSCEFEILITAKPVVPTEEVKKITYFFDEIKKCYSSISTFKTINAAPYVLASIKKKQLHADEMILLDCFDHISECTASNLFYIKENVVYTPDLYCGCIEGISRKQLLTICNREKIPIVEGKYKIADVLNADFVFNANVSGMSILSKIENRTYSQTSEIYFHLREILENWESVD